MKKNVSKAIVLVSGGMDSLVSACIAKQDNDEVILLHINYGQRTEWRELISFQEICKYLQPTDSKIISLNFFKDLIISSLTDRNMNIPTHEENKQNSVILPNTYVPFRNGIFLSIAAGIAESLLVNKIYIGAVEIDGSGYPDCRKTFFDTMQIAINNGTGNDFNIEIVTPLLSLSKADIVSLGAKINAPFELSWSCYKNNDLQCGTCDSCVLRTKAFLEAGVIDPILQKGVPNGK